jgi:hypothetical protein
MSARSKKQKPRLHLVRGGNDPELYNPEIDWFFGCFDSECGLRSIGELQRDFIEKTVKRAPKKRAHVEDDRNGELKVKVGKQAVCTDPDVLFDLHVRGVLTKGRRVWRRLHSLPREWQEVLKRWYEPRQYFPPEFVMPSEAQVRLAHFAYRAVRL